MLSRQFDSPRDAEKRDYKTPISKHSPSVYHMQGTDSTGMKHSSLYLCHFLKFTQHSNIWHSHLDFGPRSPGLGNRTDIIRSLSGMRKPTLGGESSFVQSARWQVLELGLEARPVSMVFGSSPTCSSLRALQPARQTPVTKLWCGNSSRSLQASLRHPGAARKLSSPSLISSPPNSSLHSSAPPAAFSQTSKKNLPQPPPSPCPSCPSMLPSSSQFCITIAQMTKV